MRWTLVTLFLLMSVGMSDAYEVDDNCVWINDSNILLKTCPSTVRDLSGWIDISLISKNYTGSIDVAFGTNGNLTAVSGQFYKPVTTEYLRNYTCPILGRFNETVYLNYTLTPTKSFLCFINWTEGDGTHWEVYKEHEFEFANLTDRTAYWHENVTVDWQPVSLDIVLNRTYDGFDKWYIVKDMEVEAGKEYFARAEYRVKVNTKGKYDLCLKPSLEEIGGIHTYCLDPWWDNNYKYRTNVTITEANATALKQFQVNFSLDTATLIAAGKMNSSCADLEVVNSSGDVQPRFVWSCNTAYTNIFIQAGLLPASSTTTYWVYYGYPAHAIRNYTVDGLATYIEWVDCENSNIASRITSGTGVSCTSSMVRQTKHASAWGAYNWYVTQQITGFGGTLVEFVEMSDGNEMNVQYGLYPDTGVTINTAWAVYKNKDNTPGTWRETRGDATNYWLQHAYQTDWHNIQMGFNNTHWILKIPNGTGWHAYNWSAQTRTQYYIGSNIDLADVGTYVYFDNISVRKYVTKIPTFAVNAEETFSTACATPVAGENWTIYCNENCTYGGSTTYAALQVKNITVTTTTGTATPGYIQFRDANITGSRWNVPNQCSVYYGERIRLAWGVNV